MDVTNQESIDTSVSQIKDDYGVIYGLVNNAGITNDNLLMRMSDEQWNTVIETNLTSLYRVTKSVVKDMMKARTGRIINIGSIVGMMGNAGQSNYSATKSGLLGFTKSLAREVSSRNINVNAISPGFIDTDMTRALSEEQIETLTKNIPLGRIASPDEVSSVVAFLLSDDSSYITGENINVNGGLYMMNHPIIKKLQLMRLHLEMQFFPAVYFLLMIQSDHLIMLLSYLYR
jgi:3-oxoacyl-[acyl-carrier protein] reductase